MVFCALFCLKKTKKGGFSGSLGFILAAAGSAVGLGNIWRFPYMVGQNGGAAFIIIYIIYYKYTLILRHFKVLKYDF